MSAPLRPYIADTTPNSGGIMVCKCIGLIWFWIDMFLFNIYSIFGYDRFIVCLYSCVFKCDL